MRKPYFLVLALAAVVTLVALIGSRKHPHLSQVLADGSFLRIVDVSYGTNHTYVEPAPKAWQRYLARTLPFSWTRGFGWHGGGHGSISAGVRRGETNLAIVTTCEQATLTSFTASPRLVAFDSSGNTFDASFGGGTLGESDGKHSRRVILWTLDAFPRRGDSISLRFLELGADKKSWQRVAEFRVPNPAMGNYRVWLPEPIPTTKTDGDLSVTLTGLTAGISQDEPSRAARGDEIAATRAIFHVAQTGHANCPWRAKSIEISDATGNRWTPLRTRTTIEHKQDADEIMFPGALWPGESAWKLRVEFSRVADFDVGELWTVRGIMVPGATQVITLDNSTTIQDTGLRLVAMTGKKAKQPGTLEWMALPGVPNISIHADAMGKGRRLSLVKVVDDQGREVKFQPGTDWDNGEMVFGLEIQSDAKSLDCTFACPRSRFVEFLAKPEFASAQTGAK